MIKMVLTLFYNLENEYEIKTCFDTWDANTFWIAKFLLQFLKRKTVIKPSFKHHINTLPQFHTHRFECQTFKFSKRNQRLFAQLWGNRVDDKKIHHQAY